MTELWRSYGACVHDWSKWDICFNCDRHKDTIGGLEWDMAMDAEKLGGHRAVEHYVMSLRTGYGRNNLIIYDENMQWSCIDSNANCVQVLEEAATEVDFETVWDWPFIYRSDYNADGVLMTKLGPAARKWLRWLANDSLYAPCFITKAPLAMLHKGVLYDSRIMPARVLISAMCGVRYIGENPSIPIIWDRWLPYVAAHEALYFAHCTEFHAGGNVRSAPNPMGHSMFDVTDTLFGRYEFRRLVKGQYIKGKPVHTSGGWSDLCRQFGQQQPTPEMELPNKVWMTMTNWLLEFRRINS